ncbi:MAG: hypothetical protein ABI315_12585 [Bacteroidia bacterium]
MANFKKFKKAPNEQQFINIQLLNNENNSSVPLAEYNIQNRNQPSTIKNQTSNGYRRSYNTQGFDESVYNQPSLANQRGGSGYSGSLGGGVGMGSFRRYRNEDVS